MTRTSRSGRRSPVFASVALAASLMVVVASCGPAGNESGSSVTTGGAPGPTLQPRLPTRSELRDARLTLADFPSGWVDQGGSVFAGGLPDTNLGLFVCPAAESIDKDFNVGTSTIVVGDEFANGQVGPITRMVRPPSSNVIELLIAKPLEEAITTYSDLTKVLEMCVGQSWTEQSTRLTLSRKESSTGSEQAAYRLDTQDSDMTVSVDLSLELIGTVIAMFRGYRYTGSEFAPAVLDDAEFGRLVALGTDKVMGLVYSPAPNESTGTTTTPLTKAVFLEQANSVCADAKTKVKQIDVGSVSGSPEQTVPLYVEQALPILRDELDQLRSLAPPAEDRIKIEAGWDDIESLLDALEADPMLAMLQIQPKNVQLYEYGLTECFVDHVDLL